MNGTHLRKTQAASESRSVAGFTLMEILLALALGILVLAAAWKAIDLHWRYSTAGQLDMERCQLARTLLHKISLDIRSVIYRDEELTIQSATGGSADSSSSSTSSSGSSSDGSTDSGDPNMVQSDEEMYDEENYFDQSVGVIGDSVSLTLHVSKPLRGTMLATTADGMVEEVSTSDQQTIEYFLAGTMAASTGQVVQVITSDGTTANSGLVRTQGDRFEIALADVTGMDSSAIRDTRLLAPEVATLGFRYFDGVEWLEEWDSVTLGALPTAIEVTISFQPPDATLMPLVAQTASTLTDSYRLVVALPLAERYTSSEGL